MTRLAIVQPLGPLCGDVLQTVKQSAMHVGSISKHEICSGHSVSEGLPMAQLSTLRRLVQVRLMSQLTLGMEHVLVGEGAMVLEEQRDVVDAQRITTVSQNRRN